MSWTLAPVIGRASLVRRLHSEAALLDAHSAVWVRRLPPLLREASTRVDELERRLIHKGDQVAELLHIVSADEQRADAADARIAELEHEAVRLRAAASELAQVRAALLLIEKGLQE